MRAHATAVALPRQSTSRASARPDLSTDVDTVLAMLRTSVQETGWTLDALAVEMGIDKSLISRVLNGERPMTLTFLIGLPDDIEAAFERKRAESFGLIVVQPAADGQQAIQHLVSGLFGVFGTAAARLPQRTTCGPLKATLPGGPDGR